MTEAEWLTCSDLPRMAQFLQGKPCDSVRRWRLFTVACYDRVWPLLVGQERELVVVLERFADGQASVEQWHNVLRASYLREFHDPQAADEGLGYDEEDAAEYGLCMADVLASRCPYAEVYSGTEEDRRSSAEEKAAQVNVLRDIFNPFSAADRTSSRQTPSVVQLADTIYSDRAFDRLPLLADALEDAGCTDAALLSHCRGPGPHVRGCWVVDLLTGRQ